DRLHERMVQMKRFLTAVVLMVVAGSLHAAVTNEVSYAKLKVAPEKYRSKLVSFVEVYRNVQNSFPYYLEEAGFKSERWILLEIGDQRMPVLARKKEDTIGTVADLKMGAKVRMTGRVREFKFDTRSDSGAGRGAPRYYVEMDSITEEAEAGAKGNPIQPPRPAPPGGVKVAPDAPKPNAPPQRHPEPVLKPPPF
ncbi:MAG: hypothetical protein WCG36_11165, partial [bacterium]